MVNTIVGVLIMTVLDNGLVMLNVNPNIRTGVQGVIILVAVIIQLMKPTPIDDLKDAMEAGNTVGAVELYN